MSETQQISAHCPECDAAIEIPADAVASEIIDCQDCGQELEIKDPAQGTLVVAESSAEDWGQ